MRTTTRRYTEARRHRTRILLVSIVGAALLLAAGVQGAAAAPAAISTATSTCWKDVVNDWLRHQPNVTGSYPIPCYTQAIQHLSLYPDVQQYSSAMDDIHRALLAAYLDQRGNGPGGGSGGTSGPSSSGPTSSGPSSPNSSGPSSSSSGPITRIFDHFAPGNAQSVPLPLLVLGGLALLLMFAGAGTWITRRIQGKRATPAPAPATSPPTGPSRKPR